MRTGFTLATKEWEKTKETVTRSEEWLGWYQWLHKVKDGASIWDGIGHRRRCSILKALPKVKAIYSRAHKALMANSCPGCFEYSEGGHLHDSPYCHVAERGNR